MLLWIPIYFVYIVCLLVRKKLADRHTLLFRICLLLLLGYRHCLGDKLVTGGDFNVHFNRPAYPTTAKVLDLTKLFGLSGAAEFPTLSQGHTLDPFTYKADDQIFWSVSPHRIMSLDHMPVVCYLDIAKPPCGPMFQIKSQFRKDVSLMIVS